MHLVIDGQKLDSIRLNAENGWQGTFSNLPADLDINKVSVIEDDIPGFTAEYSDLEVTSDTDKFAATITNTPIRTGSLTVAKTISGDDASSAKDFTFTIILNDTIPDGIYGDMTFEDSVAAFVLKANESKTAAGLPADIGYTVSESDNSGYTVTVNGSNETTATGTIIADSTETAAFNNHKSTPGDDKDTPEPAWITIKAVKTLDGAAPNGSNFNFMLKDDKGSVIQTVKNNGDGITFDPLSFSETGTYLYALTEIAGTDSTINYDNTVYKIIVEVTKSDNYTATVSYEKDGQVYADTPAFSNTTKPAASKTIIVSANKVWDDNNSTSRPVSVIVQLYKGGVPYGDSVSLHTGNGWRYVWNDLDESATWAADEVNTPSGYTKNHNPQWK